MLPLWGSDQGSRTGQVQQLAAPLFDEFSYAISLVGAEVIHNHDLSRPQAWGEHFFEVSLENTSRSVAPSTAREEGPIPSTLMLASKVVFFPRLRGTE